jgi:deoxycytidylate deaminase
MIGWGYNGPGDPCGCHPCLRTEIHDNSRLELCNGVHAEEDAIVRACKAGYGEELNGATIIHIRLKNGAVPYETEPSCPPCAARILRYGLAYVVLAYNAGAKLYSVKDFVFLSREYHLAVKTF